MSWDRHHWQSFLLRLRQQSLLHRLRTSSIVSRSPSPPPFPLSRSELAVSFISPMLHLACVSLVSFTVDSAGVPLLSQPPSSSPPDPLSPPQHSSPQLSPTALFC
ncbi:hypothetical protein BT69DRAFT_1276046 [Atractiella rhizophila]|nr:hypothetical protein BT69DRAFT_1276046 [Atractiella rhizophila]